MNKLSGMKKLLLSALIIIFAIALSGSALATIIENIAHSVIAEQTRMLLAGIGLVGLAGIGRKKGLRKS